MSEGTESNLEDNLIILTNAEVELLKENYFKLNPDAISIDIGLEKHDFTFERYIKGDGFVHIFTIVDRKKFSYARIKYEF